MNVLIVTKERLRIPQTIELGGLCLHFRSELSGLKSVYPDAMILEEGLSKEQEALALSKARVNPFCRIYSFTGD